MVGNIVKPILKNLLPAIKDGQTTLPFTRVIACVRSEASQKKLTDQYAEYGSVLTVSRGRNIEALKEADVTVLAVDPADMSDVLSEGGHGDIGNALSGKLVISVAAGWTKEKLEILLYGSKSEMDSYSNRAWIVRALPNVAMVVGQGLTVIEDDPTEPRLPREHLELSKNFFESVGKTVEVHPRLLNASAIVGGSTPAFWAIICDAFIDAAVAVGVPREEARTIIYQSMRGSAEMLQSGVHPGELRDQGTAPEGPTIGGIMALEEAGVRGHLGRALREAVTVARMMGDVEHPNDTRR